MSTDLHSSVPPKNGGYKRWRHVHFTRMRIASIRDAGTTGAAGAVAPVAFCLDNFTGALRVQNEGAAERV